MRATTTHAMGKTRASVDQPLESTFWWLFLVFLALFSIVSKRFDSSVWQFSVSIFYGYFAVFGALVASSRLRVNLRALRAAAPVIAALAAIPLWLYLQTILPVSGFQSLIAASWQPSPQWFEPKPILSLVPERTVWLAQASFLCFCWFILCLCQIRNRQRLKQLLWVLWWLAIFHAVTALLALKTGFYLFDSVLLDGHFDAARGWFVNRNHFAAMLVATGSSGCAIWAHQFSNISRREPGAKQRSRIYFAATAWFIGSCVVVIALVLAKSRAGLLAPLLSVFAFLAIALFYGRLRMRVFTSFAAIACLIVLSLILVQTPLGQRLLNGALSIGERGTQWQLTWQAIKLSPWLGFGGGSYGTVFQFFRDHAELRHVVYNQSHNEYLHVWLEQGLIGLSLWLVVITATIRYAFVSLKEQASKLVRVTVIAASLGLAAALLQAGVDFSLQLINLRCFFLLLAAMVFAAPNIKHRKRTSSLETEA